MRLHQLLLGSLRMLGWLLFQPSSFRAHVAAIAPHLPADFALAQLRREDLKNPALRDLLAQRYLLPTLACCAAALWCARALNLPPEKQWLCAAFCVAFSLAFDIVGGVASGLVLICTSTIAASLTLALGPPPFHYRLLLCAAGCAGFGAAGSTLASLGVPHGEPLPITRRTGPLIGGFIGAAAGLVALGVLWWRDRPGAALGDPGVSLVLGVLGGAVCGLASGCAAGPRWQSWLRTTAFGAPFGAVFGITGVIWVGLKQGPLMGLAFGAVFALLLTSWHLLPGLFALALGMGWACAVVGTLSAGGTWLALIIFMGMAPAQVALRAGLAAMMAGLTLPLWRPLLLYPLWLLWNARLRRRGRPEELRWHGAFLDELQWLPLVPLKGYLLLVYDRDRAQGEAAITALRGTLQGWAADQALIELDIRCLEACHALQPMSQVHRALRALDLPQFDSAVLRSFGSISRDIEAAQRQEYAIAQKEQMGRIQEDLNRLARDLLRSPSMESTRFSGIINRWSATLEEALRGVDDEIEQRQEISNPYIVGRPLPHDHRLFRGRAATGTHITRLLRERHDQPLLLYGPYRMGKTSLLINLPLYLPSHIIPCFMDLQRCSIAAVNDGALLRHLAENVRAAAQQRDLKLPPLRAAQVASDPYGAFFAWLTQAEAALGECSVLLALDEFVMLRKPFDEGRLREDGVLGALRHIVQHCRRFRVLIAAPQTPEELRGWATYLINLQVIRLGHLPEEDARTLVEHPAEDFGLTYEAAATRRVLDLTRGHPHLLQLLCYNIVSLKNTQPRARRRLATVPDVEAAAAAALDQGQMFFYGLEQLAGPAGVTLLRQLALGRSPAGPPAELEPTLKLLVDRQIIEEHEGGHRFQVELMRRWFARA